VPNARLAGAIGPEGRALGIGGGESVRDVRRVFGMLFRGRIENHDAEVRDLIAAVAGKPRFWPALHPEARLDERLVGEMCDAVVRRLRGAPFAYAVGRAAFRHLTLDVDDRVLIPRQETEVLVDMVLEWAAARGAGGLAIDVGTGSGAIALALATEGAFDRVIATDVSTGAVQVARANAERLAGALRAPVEIRQGALLAPVRGEMARVVVSNPPYVAYREMQELPSSVRDWEPPTALYAGDGGMAVIAALAREARAVLEPGGLLAMEIDCRRGAACAELLRAQGCYHDVRVRPDLTGRDRVLTATRQDG
jgi:release factor glutamine methyltransferase